MYQTTRRTFLKHGATLAGAAGSVWGLPSASRAEATGPKGRWKYAICNETFLDWRFERAFALAAQCGYRGIEFAPFTMAAYATEITARRRSEVRRQVEREGLATVGLHWLLAKTKGFHLTSPDRGVRRKTAEYLGRLAELATELGGKILVLGSPAQRNRLPGVTRAQAMQYAADVLRMAMPMMERTGAVVGLEPLSPKDTTFMNTAAEAVGLAQMVGSPHCRLHLDCKAMFTESTPIPTLIRLNHQQVVHFHANDPNLKGPGFGQLDFIPIFKALAEVGYQGWVSVEVFDYSPGPERLARESIRYMRQCAP
jgi:sugar phosphate isomerase/epimerase